MKTPILLISTCTAAALLTTGTAAFAAQPTRPALTKANTNVEYTALESVQSAASTADFTQRLATPNQPFEMVGVTWSAGKNHGAVEVRVLHENNTWSEWQPLHVHDDGADQGSSDAAEAQIATEPWFTDTATKVELRVPRANQQILADARLVTISSPHQQADDAPPLASAASAGAAPRIISREQWGVDLSAQKCKVGHTMTEKAAVLHHTTGTSSYSKAGAYRLVRSIHAYHTKVRGWCDVGYQFIVDKYGQTFEGRRGKPGRAVRGAHASGFNSHTFAVSLLGTYMSGGMNSAQINAVSDVMAWRLGNYYRDPQGTAQLTSAGISGTNTSVPKGTVVTRPRIMGHRDLGSTSCPGDKAYAQLPQLRKLVKQKIRDYTKSPIWQEWNKRGAQNGWLGEPRFMEENIHGGVGTTFARGAILERNGKRFIASGGIGHSYARMGGLRSFFGRPTTNEYTVGKGRAQKFSGAGGAIYWSRDTGAHRVYGGIGGQWNKLGGATGYYGFPTSSEQNVPGRGSRRARYNTFERGDVYWTPETGAHGIVRGFYGHYKNAGGAAVFGFPTSEERTENGIARQTFDKNHGAMYWSAKGGLHYLNGKIEQHYSSKGFSKNPYGHPTGGVRKVHGGSAAMFQNADIHDQNGTIREVRGSIRTEYRRAGGFNMYGVATSGVLSEGNAKVQRFHHLNSAIYITSRGVVPTFGGIGWKYRELGGAAGRLGAPVKAEYNTSTGAEQRFERGVIRWDRATGKLNVQFFN